MATLILDAIPKAVTKTKLVLCTSTQEFSGKTRVYFQTKGERKGEAALHTRFGIHIATPMPP